MIEGAVIALVSLVVGMVLRPTRSKQGPPRPVCGCDHNMALHDPKTGECHGKVEEPTHFSPMGSPVAYVLVPCTCRQYVGPKPIEEFFTTPMLPPGDDDAR